jgi:hypothetical protein
MNNFDRETNILKTFRTSYAAEETYLLPERKDTCNLIECILLQEQWIDSSGKSEIPPDFYSPKFKLMMEVMRIDDHAYKNHKGKIRNPTNERESFMQKELRDSGILEKFPNVTQIICNPDTGLSTIEDHNYKFYRKNFARAIEKHKCKIPQYRENHPNYKLVFFVFDESSAYCQVLNRARAEEPMYQGKCTTGSLHFHWADKAFLDGLIGSDVDYLVWHTPYKLVQLETGNLLPIPRTCVFDLKNAEAELHDYDETLMVSSEV